MGEEVQQRVAAATAVVADERKRLNAQPFQLHILVRAECDSKGLKALLQSLQDVKYGEDEVQVTVATTCSAAARSAQEFPWFHGPRRIIELSGNSAKPTDPLPLWFPTSPKDIGGDSSEEEESTGAHVSGLFGIALDPDSPFLAEDSPIMTGFKRPEETLLGGAAAAAAGGGAAAAAAARGAARGAAGAAAGGVGGAGGEAGMGVLSLAMARTCQVVFPQPWRQFWAWHALSQAQQVTSAHLKFDWDAYDFSAPCREAPPAGKVRWVGAGAVGRVGGGREGGGSGGSGGGGRERSGNGGAVAGDGSHVPGGVSSAVAAVLGVARAVSGPAGQFRPPQVRLGRLRLQCSVQGR
ncbi:unnamed protein product [Closterium sp. Yama58-4]|nr:unnamed protein product [Closterium sp. Yama58-4]